MNKIKFLSPVVLRIGMAGIFLWFGFDQLIHTSQWLAFIPVTLLSYLPSFITATLIVHLNGIFEIIFGVSLLLGFYTRFTAFILALHLLDITYIVGYSSLAVRDFGLAIALICIWLNGRDFLTLDRYMENDVVISN